MRIVNANIVLENSIIHGYVEFDKNKIIKIKAGRCRLPGYDAKGLYLLPAFIDSHTHGGYGFDFNMLSTEYNQDLAKKYLASVQHEGVGGLLMTTVTASNQDLDKIANNYQTIKAIDTDNLIKG
jgi:N-acetylglucosamine-6-phosphate deacetylase